MSTDVSSVELIAEPIGNYKPLLSADGVLYSAKGYKIFASSNQGDSYAFFSKYRVPLPKRILAHFDLSNNILREGFHDLKPTPNGGLLAIVKKAIVYKPESAEEFTKVLDVKRGSRPLGLCVTPAGTAYFGEYFGNPERKAVHIYGSTNYKDWEIVYTFPKGRIRHIHNIVFDKFRDGVWVLTGDSDQESGIWFTKDNFSSLELVYGGNQKARLVNVIPTRDKLIAPMDSEYEANYINAIEPKGLKVTPLHKMPGSIFNAISLGPYYLCSTAYEPSKVNKRREIVLSFGGDASPWQQLMCLKVFPFWLPAKLLQYPSIRLLAIENESSPVFYLNHCFPAKRYALTLANRSYRCSIKSTNHNCAL